MSFDLNGVPVHSLRMVVPQRGIPDVEVVFSNGDDLDEIDGLDVLTLEGVPFSGTFSGAVHEGERRGRFVLGSNGWSQTVPARAYANDAGIKASKLVSDLASAVGETVDTGGLEGVTVGVNFSVQVGTAASNLYRIAPDWHVDRSGTTHFTARVGEAVPEDVYRLVDYDSRTEVALLDVDDLASIDVGDTIVVGGETKTIRTLVVTLENDTLTVEAWTGGDSDSQSDLGDVIAGVFEAYMSRKLLGVYRYRVALMNGERVDVQPVNDAIGLPLLSGVEMWTAPGVSAQLTPGVHCAVQFLDGDAGQPIIMAVAGAFDPNHEPDTLNLGGTGGSDACSVGDLGNVFLPGIIPVSGTVSGAPFVGTMTITSAVTCVMQTGSKKVKLKK